MSLTSFLKLTEVRTEFTNTFKFENPKLSGDLKAKPQSENYTLVGTAFDYLLRFHVERLNANSITKMWVAESAMEKVREKPIGLSLKATMARGMKPRPVGEPTIYEKIEEGYAESKENYLKFRENGILSDKLLRSCVFLAKLDPIVRAGISMFNPKVLDMNNEPEITDLKNLMSIVNFDHFKSSNVCMLNPTFGAGSIMVGGADADLVIDDTLIDVKTTKNLKITRENYNQLIGYYILSKIGGIGGTKEHKIKNVAIYFSRHGLLHTIPVSRFENNPKFDSFLGWFKEKAERVSLSSQ